MSMSVACSTTYFVPGMAVELVGSDGEKRMYVVEKVVSSNEMHVVPVEDRELKLESDQPVLRLDAPYKDIE